MILAAKSNHCLLSTVCHYVYDFARISFMCKLNVCVFMSLYVLYTLIFFHGPQKKYIKKLTIELLFNYRARNIFGTVE